MTNGDHTMSRGPTCLVRIYGDSLSLPRFEDEIRYPDSYTELVARGLEAAAPGLLVSVYNRSQGAWTIDLLREAYDKDHSYFGDGHTDLLIIQCGVCDCAPRPLPPRARKVVGKLPSLLRHLIIGLLHRNRARLLNWGVFWRNTDPVEFRKQLAMWLERASSEAGQVCVINIAPTLPHIEAHSPGFGNSIRLFNTIISEEVVRIGRDNVHCIDVYSAICEASEGPEQYVNSKDGHHITREGHRAYAQRLLSVLLGAGR
jgi:hypothetical protein